MASSGDAVVTILARIFGVADVPWAFRWGIGLMIGLLALYLFLILHGTFSDAEGARELKAWVLDGLKITFGAVIGIIGQSAGLHQNSNVTQAAPAHPPP